MMHPRRFDWEAHKKALIRELREARRSLETSNERLDAVRQIVDEWGRQRDDPYGMEYDWYYKDKYFKLRDALEGKK